MEILSQNGVVAVGDLKILFQNPTQGKKTLNHRGLKMFNPVNLSLQFVQNLTCRLHMCLSYYQYILDVAIH